MLKRLKLVCNPIFPTDMYHLVDLVDTKGGHIVWGGAAPFLYTSDLGFH